FKLSNIDVKSYGLGLHLFRHSFATFIYDETQDLVLTSRALGHQSLSSTKIYIHTAQEYNKQVASIFDNLLSG
ncbi:tyrosine-type recombinase/integrase, partial [Helicobacter pylori]